MTYETINLKEHGPTVNQALGLLEIEIEIAKKSGIKVLKIIHGWGSHGTGGAIKQALKLWLPQKKSLGFITDYCPGELWPGNNEAVQKIKDECPDVLGDIELFYSNAGITMVLV
ncbi:MAG: Smr/MutS family protein [Firmicutes bacterium]|nr:Smr/MutS family protein [Bacillota bacterium]